MELQWKKIKGKPPLYEVLAVNDLGNFWVGTLEKTKMKGENYWICVGRNGAILYFVQYYIPLKELLKTLPLSD